MRKNFLPKAVKDKSELDNGKRIHKDYQRRRPCPIQGCKSVVKRLSGHLHQVHQNIPAGSPLFKEILTKAQAAKTWKPSGCVKRAETENEQASTGALDGDVEIKSDTGSSELPSIDKESVIMELAEEAHCSNVENEIDVISTFYKWLQEGSKIVQATRLSVVSYSGDN